MPATLVLANYAATMQPTGATLISGEGVRLELSTSGIGSRTIAAAIDIVLQAFVLLVLVIATVLLAGESDSAALGALALVETVLVLAGYPIVAEWLSHGRTVGKLMMGLRVVRDDGGPIGFRQALVRGLAGLVLEKPGLLFPLTTVAGALTVSLSGQEKRIGDMMAGTVVLDERSGTRQLPSPPAWVDPPLQPWAMSVDLQRLDDRLALRLRQFVVRAHEMSPDAQWSLGESLRLELLDVISPPPPAGAPTSVVLSGVLAERRRRAAWVEAGYPAGGRVAPASPPYPPPHPPTYSGGVGPSSAPPLAASSPISPFSLPS